MCFAVMLGTLKHEFSMIKTASARVHLLLTSYIIYSFLFYYLIALSFTLALENCVSRYSLLVLQYTAPQARSLRPITQRPRQPILFSLCHGRPISSPTPPSSSISILESPWCPKPWQCYRPRPPRTTCLFRQRYHGRCRTGYTRDTASRLSRATSRCSATIPRLWSRANGWRIKPSNSFATCGTLCAWCTTKKTTDCPSAMNIHARKCRLAAITRIPGSTANTSRPSSPPTAIWRSCSAGSAAASTTHPCSRRTPTPSPSPSSPTVPPWRKWSRTNGRAGAAASPPTFSRHARRPFRKCSAFTHTSTGRTLSIPFTISTSRSSSTRALPTFSSLRSISTCSCPKSSSPCSCSSTCGP